MATTSAPVAGASTTADADTANLQGLTLSSAAAAHICSYAAGEGSEPVVRIGVRTSSCSAHAYTMELDARAEPGDQVFESKGVRLVIDPKSLLFLDGTAIDYRREGLQEGFQFENPNVKGTCGCGESFTI